jgi:uncharacterized RDD family membrane protein YckC
MDQNYNYVQPPPGEDLFQTRPLIYASFWKRLAAIIIDSIIIAAVFIFAAIFLSVEIYYIIALFGSWLYFSLQESGPMQATVGKRAMKIKVVGENGERISFGKATGRHFGKIISGFILYIGYLMVLWDSRRQGLHDKLAGTYIVEEQPQFV